jgi:hypothetical protein
MTFLPYERPWPLCDVFRPSRSSPKEAMMSTKELLSPSSVAAVRRFSAFAWFSQGSHDFH